MLSFSLNSFFKIYLKYIKILQANGLNLELNLLSCYNSIFLFKNNSLSFLKISVKLERFVSNLIFFSKIKKIEKQRKNKWFNFFIKIYQKKLKLYIFSKSFKKFDTCLYQAVFSSVRDFDKNSLEWFKYKFLKFTWKNQSSCWKMIKTIFTCSICKEIVASVNSYKIMEFAHFIQTLFFLKQLAVSSTSTFSTCKFCSKITKIIKKCLIYSNNFSIWINFKFLKKRFKKIFGELTIKKTLNIRTNSSASEHFFWKNNIFFETHSFPRKVSGSRFIFNLHSRLFISKFIENLTRSKNIESKEGNITKKDEKSLHSNDFYTKLKRYKLTECIFFKVFNENINNRNRF